MNSNFIGNKRIVLLPIFSCFTVETSLTTITRERFSVDEYIYSKRIQKMLEITTKNSGAWKRPLCFVNSMTRFYLIAVTLTAVSGAWKPQNSEKESVCSHAECTKAGALLLQNMNPKADPCEDFYEFACGNWVKHNPVQKYTQESNVFTQMDKRLMTTYKKILDENRFTRIERDYLEAQTVFRACSKIPSFPRLDGRNLAAQIKRVGSYPKTLLWDIHNRYMSLTGESAFFNYLVISNIPQPGVPIVIYYEASSAYGAMNHQIQWTQSEEKAYFEFLFQIMKSLKLPETSSTLRIRIHAVVLFRKQLAKIIAKNEEKDAGSGRAVTPERMQATFNSPRLKYRQNIPWRRITHILLHSLPANVIDINPTTDVRNVEYFSDLVNLLGNTPEDVLANHIQIHFVEKHLKYKDDMIKLLQATASAPSVLSVLAKSEEIPRWGTCLVDYNRQRILAKLYVKKVLPKSQINSVHEIIGKVKEVMKKQMNGSSWLTPEARNVINKKLDSLVEWVAYPPWFLDPNIKGEDLGTEPGVLVPTATFNIPLNRMFVRVPLIAPPFFNPYMPAMYNLAGIGSTIGHELYHILANCGSYEFFDEKNQLKKLEFWPDSMQQQCLRQGSCFVSQYDELTKKVFKDHYGVKKATVDTKISFMENYADVMGIDTIYNVYKHEVQKNPNTCQTLLQFMDYSCDQMFFLSFANKFCGYVSRRQAEHYLQHDRHSTPRVRVNGVVMNNENFAKAFHCRAGSRMNPVKKCNIWK